MTSKPPNRSKAFDEYLQSRHEVITLLKAVPSDEEQLSTRSKRELANAIFRGSVVLLSSHLERYCESLVVEAIDAFNAANLPTGKIPEKLRRTQVKDALDDISVLVQKDRSFRNIFETVSKFRDMLVEYSWFLEETLPYTKLKSGPLVEENRFSNPSPPKINELFEHFGIMSVVGQAIALDHKSDRGSIEKKTAELVEKRNAVAHTGMTIDLTRENVVSYLVYARRLVRGIDTVVGREIERLIGTWPWK